MREKFRIWFQNWLIANWSNSWPSLIMQGDSTPSGEFCRASLQFGNTIPAQVGGGMKRTPVFASIQIFVADETGTKKPNTIADFIVDNMSGKVFSFNGVTARVIEISGPQFVGRQDAGEQFNVVVQYEADEN